MAGLPRIASVLTAALFNAIPDAVEALAQRMLGKGVLSGFAITPGAGLSVNVAGGYVLGLRVKSIPGATLSGLAPSSELYVFVDEDGDWDTYLSPADPGGTSVCVGRVVTDATSVVSADKTGRVDLPRMSAFRRFEVGDALLAVDLSTGRTEIKEVSGPGGALSYGHASRSVAGLTAYTLTGAEAAKKVVELTGALTADCVVSIPAVAGAEYVVRNSTTGAFALKAKKVGGTEETTVPAGGAKHLYATATDLYSL